MAREISEIKRGMTDVFVQNATIAELYGLQEGKTFDEQFSKVSLESILFYVVAFGIFALEKIFDTHRAEVNQIIENILPHRPKWYRDKALNFLVDMDLIEDTDRYDTGEMTDGQIEEKRIVKYATAIEEPGSSVLVIKIATGEPGALEPLPGGSGIEATGQAGQFVAYINEIRDAGVRWNLVNLPGDEFKCELDIYYSPLLNSGDVERSAKTAIQNYITGLPFNGEFSNMALVDAVQQVEGVQIVEFKSAQKGIDYIDAKCVPTAGYFTYAEDNINLNLTAHNAVQ